MCPPELTMPIEMALQLYRAKEEFLFRTSGSNPNPNSCKHPNPTTTSTSKAFKPALSSCLRLEPATTNSHNHSNGLPVAEDPGNPCGNKKKKNVIFADQLGLALTKIKVFSALRDPIEIPINITEMLESALKLNLSLPAAENPTKDELVLDFSQPSSDYLGFRLNLEKNSVCLEHCVLKEKSLAGTVKVRNISFEKAVKLRLTHDSWTTHTDVDCVFVRNSYQSSYSDTFSFQVSLPEDLKPSQKSEFAVCFETGGQQFWDSNNGQNYKIIWMSMKTVHRGSADYGTHSVRYGSPTLSHGLMPDWPMYAGHENAGPYY